MSSHLIGKVCTSFFGIPYVILESEEDRDEVLKWGKGCPVISTASVIGTVHLDAFGRPFIAPILENHATKLLKIGEGNDIHINREVELDKANL